ncbi:hypothetical protein AZE42_09676 [Rhizopogon vesiculosus]|uniref:F-box domain-containing protein n=1 Tax=Rhizopogon vesiculosus TaxID=180088 RepID=A0A1J8QLS4_9AGAM|nr:hypothetical protein AZE42_09676 [Rhizopogon vesiculosus]
MPTIDDLPEELLDGIARLLPRGTLFSLSTVSTLFRPFATRWLYRQLGLAGNADTIRICKAIISNPLAAISVRRVLLWPGLAFSRPDTIGAGGPFYSYLSSFYKLLSRALSRATKVESIRLMFPYCGASMPLDICTFPNLRSFATTMEPYTLASFIKRHPQLQELHISLSHDRSLPLPEFRGISLPLLKSACLPESLLFMVSPEAPLRSILSVEIEDNSEAIPNYVGHLSRFSTTLSELHLCRLYWNDEIPMLIATSLPNVTSFAFTRMSPGLRHESNVAFLNACEAALPLFSSLSQLRAEVARNQGDCTVLMITTTDLTSRRSKAGTAWHRLEDDIWMPDLHQKAALEWLFEAACTGEFPDDITKTSILGHHQPWNPLAFTQTEDDDDSDGEMDEPDIEIEPEEEAEEA